MRRMLRTRWVEVGEKIVALATAYPSSAYDEHPTPEIRSFAEQLRHIAFWNQFLNASLAGAPGDGQANELPRDTYPTKPKLLEVLAASFAEVTGALGDDDQPLRPEDAETVVAFLLHGGEHYGQLAVYCRLHAIVPPASR